VLITFSCVKKDEITNMRQKNDSIMVQLSVQPIPESKVQNDTIWAPPTNPTPRPDSTIVMPVKRPPANPKPRG